MRAIFAAAAVCLCLAVCMSPADARPRHFSISSSAGANGRPAGCPARLWCGCWLMHDQGLNDRRLWKASVWSRLGTAASSCRPGLIAVWPHHVGRITDCLGGGMVRLISGNDGNAVRDRVRPLGRARLRAL